jgi:hypothetical protein
MAVMDRNLGVRDGAAAKAEKRKKVFVIVGSVVLLAVLAFEVPKTLKRLHPPPPPTSASSAQATPATGAPTSAVAMPTRAQRRALAHLKVHDPFAPLIRGDIGGGTPAGSSAPAPSGSVSTPTSATAGKPAAKTDAAPAADQPPIGFSTPNAPKVIVPAPAAAIIWVNGSRQTVGLKALFPLKAQAFQLVSVDRKTLRIRVVGGSFTGGRAVITLRRGRAVTLVNTVTGVRYVLRFATPLAALPTIEAPSATTPSGTEPTKTDKSK